MYVKDAMEQNKYINNILNKKRMEKFIRTALMLIFALCTTGNMNAQNSYKHQQKLERKAKKIHKRLGIDENRVLELMKMNKEETKSYVKFLKELNTSDDEIMMEYSTDKIVQMKNDYKYYANKAARKRNKVLLGGLGAYIAGIACIGIGGKKAADCPPLLYSGVGVAAAGFGAFMYEYVVSVSGNDLAKRLYAKSRTLIVESPVRPLNLNMGKDYILQAGATIFHNKEQNSIAMGPSVALTF